MSGRQLMRMLFAVATSVAAILSPLHAQQDPRVSSGHHYSYLEGAQIGHDFGRNPFARSGQDAESLGFASAFGRSRLDQALALAVAAGETRMSFDLGFDMRSLVLFEQGKAISLDAWVLDSVDAFLAALDRADAEAEKVGRRFSADVVLVDHALADGVSQEGVFTVGEHPELITDAGLRAQWLDVMADVFVKLVSSDRVTINLMNEPEFVSMSALDAAQRVAAGRFGDVRLVEAYEGRRKVTTGGVAARLLSGDPGRHVRVLRQSGGVTELAFTKIEREELIAFLVDLWQAVDSAMVLRADFDRDGLVGFSDFLVFAGSFGRSIGDAGAHPACDLDEDGAIGCSDFLAFSLRFGRTDRRTDVTIGWADDLSALENTPIIESRTGSIVTNVISFHVYDVPENRFHPLGTTRSDWGSAGFGDREIRITEWGLGRQSTPERMRSAVQDVRQAGFEGVLFWWDADHNFSHEAFRLAIE